MKTRINDIFLSALILLFLSFSSFCQEAANRTKWDKIITSGINYSHIKRTSGNGYLHIHVLKVDLRNDKVNVKPGLANGIIGNLETTSSIAERYNAIAAINGSFFEARKKLHLPIGFMVIDGQVVNKSILERTALGITGGKEILFGIPKTSGYVIDLDNKKSVKIWGVNRPRKNNEVIIYTNEYGETTRTNKFGKEIIVGPDGKIAGITEGDSAIPKDGFVVSLHGWSRDFISKIKPADRIGLVYEMSEKWKDVKQAITGGPLLIKDGEIVHKESIENEKFKNEILPPNSRTAIGVTKDNELLMVVVDKHDMISEGVTYDELADIMKDEGSVNAMGMDGGHASTMYINGKVVNYPLWGSEGRVSNAIIVTYDGWSVASIPKAKVAYKIAYLPPSEELIASLRMGAEFTPTTYVPRPEDFGMYGLYDLYNRVIKPVVPPPIIQQLSSVP